MPVDIIRFLSDKFDKLFDLCVKFRIDLIVVNMIMIIFICIQCPVLPAGEETSVLMTEVRDLVITKQ